jgi:hypothetical protein
MVFLTPESQLGLQTYTGITDPPQKAIWVSQRRFECCHNDTSFGRNQEDC